MYGDLLISVMEALYQEMNHNWSKTMSKNLIPLINGGLRRE